MGKRLNFSACPLKPTAHQVVGIQKLVTDPVVFLCDEMGMGKSMQVIASAGFLFQQGVIDKVVIVAPAPVKSVWSDPELGQLVTHGWPTLHHVVDVQGSRLMRFEYGNLDRPPLTWIVTNYEWLAWGMRKNSRFITPRLQTMMDRCDDRTLLVLDESSYIKSTSALRTRACRWVRTRCGRVALLTGTPVAHSPLDLLSQANMLDPSILSDRPGETMGLMQFRTKYCVMGGWQGKVVLSYRNIEDLQERLRPFTLRREKKDCLDLPPKLAPVTLTATLTPQSWTLYRDMRDHMIVELSGEVSVAQQAVTKLIRLSQLTSGFLGGLGGENTRETGAEKIKLLMSWMTERLEEDPTFKVVIWSQFKADVARVAEALEDLNVKHHHTRIPLHVGRLWGQNSAQEREETLRLLHPTTAPKGAVAVVGTPQTGAFGITLASATSMIFLNNGPSLSTRLQAEDRIHRPGQTGPSVSYFEVAAEGPKGQRTIDHLILKALRQRRELAEWTASAWRDALVEQRTSDPSS